MAEIGLGIGTSHSPMLMQPAELWANHALNDQRNKELCFAPSGEILSFEYARKPGTGLSQPSISSR